MVELLVVTVGAFVVTLLVLYAAPRTVGGHTHGTGVEGQPVATWPDIPRGLDSAADRWIGSSRLIDVVAGIVTLVVLAVGLMIFRDPSIVGAESGSLLAGLGVFLVVVGLGMLGVVSFLSARRSGVSNAEATLIGMSLSGISLSVLILLVLLETG